MLVCVPSWASSLRLAQGANAFWLQVILREKERRKTFTKSGPRFAPRVAFGKLAETDTTLEEGAEQLLHPKFLMLLPYTIMLASSWNKTHRERERA